LLVGRSGLTAARTWLTAAREDAVESQSGKHCSDQGPIAAMRAREGRIIESDHVRKALHSLDYNA
jgi:hypothetical protein